MQTEQKTFREFVESIKQQITERFNTQGEMPPTWFFQLEDCTILELVTPFRNDFEKDIVNAAIRKAMAIKNVQRYIFVTEMWYAAVAKNEAKSIKNLSDYKGLRPSKRPDRKEALMLFAEDRNGDRLSGNSDIHRVGKLAMIKEVSMESTTGSFEGRFVNMFQPIED